MNCPKCGAVMKVVNWNDVEVDRCTDCHGLWFDLLEHEDLKKMPGAEALDDGDASIGKRHDANRKIDCPKCGVPMIAMTDPEQRHIRFEACMTCSGVFFDAGEFRDFKEKTIVDFFRGLRG
jgi:Zn-finger nucleic acid-binding protein